MWNKDENKIIVNLIRHGKTLLNEKHCYLGKTDAPLSSLGVSEIKERASKNIYPKCNYVFVSPLIRTAQTASIIYPGIEQIVINDFSEMDFGSFEGKNYDELKENKYYRRWIDEQRNEEKSVVDLLYSDLEDPLSVGIILPENKENFVHRNAAGFIEAIKRYEHEKQAHSITKDEINVISIVAHGGTIMSLLNAYTKKDYYSGMCSCGEGFATEVTYTVDNYGNIKISCLSVIDRICIGSDNR